MTIPTEIFPVKDLSSIEKILDKEAYSNLQASFKQYLLGMFERVKYESEST